MRTRYLLIASAGLAIAVSAAAEPAKPVHAASQPTNRPAEVIMASAEQIPAPAKRPRAARVTTCRCAGQNER